MELIKKPNQHQSNVVDGGGFRSKRSAANGGDNQRKSTEPIDHWGFLEEIDAPMWVDLALESMSTDQDINAGWFEQVHPFHQLSSHHFLSEGKLDAELLGPSSPMIPPSVSKSRGKHYRSRKWRGDNTAVSVSKKHPINSLGAQGSSSFQKARPIIKNNSGNPKHTYSLKGKLYNGGDAGGATRPDSLQKNTKHRNPKITPKLKASFDSEGTLGENRNTQMSRAKPCFGDSKDNSFITANLSWKGNSTSSSGPNTRKHKVSFVDSRNSQTITSNALQSKASIGDSEVTSIMAASFVGSKNSASLSMSDSPKHKPSFCGSKSSLESKESSGSGSNPQDSQIYGQTSGLLLAVRASLRRSYVTRQPARVEVKDKVQPKGRKSSSSKSSVGSSTYSGCKNTSLTTMRNRNRTPESRQVTEMNKPTNHKKAAVKNATKAWSGQLQVCRSNSKWEEKSTAGRPVSQETSKLKVSYQSEHRKPLRLQNLQCSDTVDPKTKESVSNTNKRNAIGHSVVGEKIESKENNAGNMLWTQKIRKHNSIGKRKEVLDPKEEKANPKNNSKNAKNEVQRVYFR